MALLRFLVQGFVPVCSSHSRWPILWLSYHKIEQAVTLILKGTTEQLHPTFCSLQAPVIWIFREGKKCILFTPLPPTKLCWHSGEMQPGVSEGRWWTSRAHGVQQTLSLYTWGVQCNCICRKQKCKSLFATDQHAQLPPVSSTPLDPPALSPHRTPKLSVPSPLFHFPKAPPGITVSPSFSVHLPHTTWPRTTSHFFSCRWWSARSVAGIPWGSYGRIQVENAGISGEFCTKGTQYQSSANKYWQASTSWLQPKWWGLTPPTSLPIPPKQFGMGCRRCSCPPHRLLPQPSSSSTPPSLLSMTGRQSFWQMTLEDGEIWGCCYLLTLQWQDGLWFCRQLQEWTWTDLEPEFCRNIWHFKKRHRNQDR